MPETYTVEVQHEEENEDNLSVTGRVNGFDCAVVINKRRMAGLTADERRAYRNRELVLAFLTKQRTIPQAPGGEQVII